MKKILIAIISILSIWICLIPMNVYAADVENNESESEELNVRNSSSGDDLIGYYGIGQNLSVDPDYDTYNMQFDLQPCDIIFEDTPMGHIAVVESIQFDIEKNIYYVRVIEAMLQTGVAYGLFDEYRMIHESATIYRVNDLTSTQITNVLYFLYQQLGKSYDFNPSRKNSSINSNFWYCSELCWAAFNYVGINLDPSSNQNNAILPSEIAASPLLSEISLTNHIHHDNNYISINALQHFCHCYYCGSGHYTIHMFRQYNGYKKCTKCGYKEYNDGTGQLKE